MRHTALAAAALAIAAGAPATAALAHQHEAGRPAAGNAQQRPHHMEETRLVISAEAQIAQAPDLAHVTAGVMTEAKTAAAAFADNAAKMNGVMRALRGAGIAERDIQTSNLTLSPQYQYVENEPPRLNGYQVSNTVTVRVRDLANLGRTLDSVVGQGGNQLHGISFSIDKADEALDAARRDAMKKARARADLYAQAAGLRVARIVSIQEGGAVPPPMPMPHMMARMSAEMSPPPPPPPISGGEISMTASVTVVFELAP
jgi:uncharacterized protein YggE